MNPTGGRRPRHRAGAVLLLGAGAVLGGCSSAPEVSLPEHADAPACTAMAWPATVSGQSGHATEPASPATHAWGDDPIIARCGLPALTPTTDDCLTVDGVDWVVRKLSDGASLTTYGTDPALEILVPQAYAPEPLVLPAFTAVAKTLPGNGRHCVG